jgi:hypothetical protein
MTVEQIFVGLLLVFSWRKRGILWKHSRPIMVRGRNASHFIKLREDRQENGFRNSINKGRAITIMNGVLWNR